MSNLKRLVEVSSLLTILIFFITEVQRQRSEISVKRTKQGLKHYTNQLTTKTCEKLYPFQFCSLSSTLTLRSWRILLYESPAPGIVRQPPITRAGDSNNKI